MLRGGAPLYIVRMECCMATENAWMKFGFVKDENNAYIKETLKDNMRIKSVHIEIYPENPFGSMSSFMLLLRTSEKNTMVLNDGKRIVFRKNNEEKTQVMNLLFSKINECFYQICEHCSEFILNIQNIWYRITVFN